MTHLERFNRAMTVAMVKDQDINIGLFLLSGFWCLVAPALVYGALMAIYDRPAMRAKYLGEK
ncbi:MAG TPA: hypothetical protein VND94_00655 [Terriglobia bacterium]|nr:hypothetical protein [Terriglobia bacterium]